MQVYCYSLQYTELTLVLELSEDKESAYPIKNSENNSWHFFLIFCHIFSSIMIQNAPQTVSYIRKLLA